MEPHPKREQQNPQLLKQKQETTTANRPTGGKLTPLKAKEEMRMELGNVEKRIASRSNQIGNSLAVLSEVVIRKVDSIHQTFNIEKEVFLNSHTTNNCNNSNSKQQQEPQWASGGTAMDQPPIPFQVATPAPNTATSSLLVTDNNNYEASLSNHLNNNDINDLYLLELVRPHLLRCIDTLHILFW